MRSWQLLLAALAGGFLTNMAQAERITALAAPPAPDLSYNASSEADGSTPGVWEPIINNSPAVNFDMSISGVSRSSSDPTIYLGIDHAIRFNASSTAAAASLETYNPNPTAADASFEIWFRPDSMTGPGQVLYQSGGGTDGSALVLEGSTLSFIASDNNADITQSIDLLNDLGFDGSQFIQAVGVYDRDGDEARLFVNGVATPPGPNATATNVNDWSGIGDFSFGGTGADAIGTDGSSPIDPGAFGPLLGEVALFNFYTRALSDQEVMDSFLFFGEVPPPLTPEPGSILLFGLALGGFGFATWQRSRR